MASTHRIAFIACLTTISLLILLTTFSSFTLIHEENEVKTGPRSYSYTVDMRRKYLGMHFNEWIRIDGDPTENDITATWLRNVTRTMDMEVLYMVQTADGKEVIADKSIDPPRLCSGQYFYDSWDRNIIKIYKEMTDYQGCPIRPGTIHPLDRFSINIEDDSKVPCQTLRFIMDLYPVNEPISAIFLVLEGDVRSVDNC